MFKGHGAERVLYVNYIIAVMVQLYTYAHSGTIIAENVSSNSLNNKLIDRSIVILRVFFKHIQSSEIAIAAYSMQWHHSNQKVRQIILMMIHRSQQAKVVRIPFFSVSLEAYMKIMSTAGSYIAVLNSMMQ